MMFLILMFLFTVVLILRHYQQYKIRWYLVEAASVMGVVLFVFLLNTDNLIAVHDQPTVNSEVDYVYISRLSADAVDGWIQGYNQAKLVILTPDFVTKKEYTNDEARHIIYSQKVLGKLQIQMANLATKYKDQPFSLGKILLPEMKQYNFAEASAYQKMKEKIPEEELHRLKGIADTYMNRIELQPEKVRLDRSTDSPLID
jgi:hypothetical protein